MHIKLIPYIEPDNDTLDLINDLVEKEIRHINKKEYNESELVNNKINSISSGLYYYN